MAQILCSFGVLHAHTHTHTMHAFAQIQYIHTQKHSDPMTSAFGVSCFMTDDELRSITFDFLSLKKKSCG